MSFESGFWQFCKRISRYRLSLRLPFGRETGLVVLVLASLFNPVLTNAQDLAGLEQGIKPYGSYHGGNIDSISMVNGNLTLHIPLISFPQRGGKLHLGFSVVYANPVYTLTFTPDIEAGHRCSAAGCYVWSWNGGGIGIGSQLPTVEEVFEPASPTCGIDTCLQNYKVVEPDGAVHQMGATAANNSIWMSMDASDYIYNNTSQWLTNRQGTRYGFNTLNGSPYPFALTQIEDDNGNLITGNFNPNNSSQVVSYTDTMGRVIQIYPQAGSTSACPTGNGLLPPTSATTWSFPGPNGSTVTFTSCYAAFPLNYTSICNGYSSCAGLTGSNNQVQSIVLPNGTAWNFAFDTTGALSQITLPTGGTISYTWGQNYYCMSPVNNFNGLTAQFTANALSRTVNANDGSGPHTWKYALSPTTNGTGQTVQTIVTDPYGNDAVHTASAIGGQGCSNYETELDEYSGSHTNGTFLRKTTTGYSSNGTYESFLTIPLAINVEPVSIMTTDMLSGKSSQVTKSWDSGVALTGNQIAIYGDLLTQTDSDFATSSPYPLLRQTVNQYMALSGPNANYYLGNNLLDLPFTVQVCSPVQSGETADCGTLKQRAYTSYGYDESGLQTSNVTEQKVAGESHPGNLTSIHRWLNGSTTSTTNCAAVTGGYLITNNVFYDTGEVQKTTDPCGYPTTYQYSSTYFGAFTTTVTNALNQTTTYAYDFNTGSATSIQDPNTNAPPTTKTYDNMNRLTGVSYPDGGSTTYCYTDGTPANCSSGNAGSYPFAVVLTKVISSSLNEISTAVVDGLGRLSQTQLNSDPSGTTFTETTYDLLGRKSQVYNPTRCSSITTNCKSETTWGVTTTNYDALSRVTSVVEQDGSTVSTDYSAFPCTTVTDEAGNSRKSCVDGLGRMTAVFEDPGTSPHLNYETDYTYDGLDNLLSVTQKGSNSANARVRTFSYDSLSHLTQAVNPESGTITYAYDADGNVITKTAPLPNQTGSATVTTTNTYDKLNRLTMKTYMDGSTQDPYTPTVQFGYDGVALTGCTIAVPGDPDTYPIGRRTSICDGSGGASWKHDKMGRILQERRTVGSASGEYDTDAYNLDGSVQSITALGYSVGYTYNGAGQTTSVKNPADPFNYVTSPTYAPSGGLTAASLGAAPITISNAYNDRLQPILLSAKTTSATLFSECFDFHLGVAINTAPCSFSAYTSGDNGNVYQIENNRDNTRTQSFTYDVLNRIKSGQSSGTQWGETFTIDAWGNLTNESPITGKTNHEGLNTSAGTNNRLSGYGYDAAGNITSNGSTSYVYDAENRLVWTSGYRYIYDGDGQRVEKCAAANATTACPTSGTNGTLYWRGMQTDPQAETDLSGNVLENYVFFGGQRIARRDASTKAVHFYFSDHLSTHGVVENAAATVCEQDIDYYPYGGQENDYCPNVIQHFKFTSKERDSESGLDNFEARYLESSMGRFMSPDPLAGHVSDPQTLNRYTYVRNNPLNLTDPTGLDFNLTCSGADTATCQGGLQGTTTTTTDVNGNQTSTFTATVISNNQNGNLVDQNGNQYSASVTGAGVSFTQAGSDQSSLGTFINGSNATTLQATNLPGFSFTFTYSKPAGNITAGGVFSYNGTAPQAELALIAAGFHHYSSDEYDILHPSSLTYHAVDFRSAGDPGTGAHAGHFTVKEPWLFANPFSALGPATGDLHLGEHNNSTPGGFWPHTQEVINTLRDRLGLY